MCVIGELPILSASYVDSRLVTGTLWAYTRPDKQTYPALPQHDFEYGMNNLTFVYGVEFSGRNPVNQEHKQQIVMQGCI